MASLWASYAMVMACILCLSSSIPQNGRLTDRNKTYRGQSTTLNDPTISSSYRPSEQSPTSSLDRGGSSTPAFRPSISSTGTAPLDTRVNEYRPSGTSPVVKPLSGVPDLVSGASEVWRSIISFALDLDRAMYETGSPNQGGNLGFSPLSIAMSLSVLLRGAHQETFKEIWKALHLEQAVKGSLVSLQTPLPPSDDLIHVQFRRILDLATNAHNNHKESGVELKIANAFFLSRDYSVKGDFLRDARHFYDTEVIPVNPDRPIDTLAIVNQWVREKTNGKIPSLLQSPPPSNQLIIGNAVYFNGAWKNPFPLLFTMHRTFTVSEREEYSVPMMQNTVQLPYFDDDVLGCQVVALPYKDELSSMYVILPHKKGLQGLEELEDRMSHVELERLLSAVTMQDVSISMPRFRLSSQLALSNVLRRLGVRSLFSDDANLSRVSDSWKLQVDEVKHETVIDVTEEGTEAAAASAVILTKDGSAKEVRVTRPFLFFIRQDQASLVLFWGRVIRPEPVPSDYSRPSEPSPSTYRPSPVPTSSRRQWLTTRPPTRRTTEKYFTQSLPGIVPFKPTERAPSPSFAGSPVDHQSSQEVVPIRFPDNSRN